MESREDKCNHFIHLIKQTGRGRGRGREEERTIRKAHETERWIP
jgi:hypothetical protein